MMHRMRIRLSEMEGLPKRKKGLLVAKEPSIALCQIISKDARRVIKGEQQLYPPREYEKGCRLMWVPDMIWDLELSEEEIAQHCLNIKLVRKYHTRIHTVGEMMVPLSELETLSTQTCFKLSKHKKGYLDPRGAVFVKVSMAVSSTGGGITN